MDKKRHKPHSSIDTRFEDGGGTKRLKEIKSTINKRVVEDDFLIDEDDDRYSDLEYFIKKLR
jgi:hypothetical protein